MCLMDSNQQFQSVESADPNNSSSSGFGFRRLAGKIAELVKNKIEQPTIPCSGEEIYMNLLWVSGKEEPREEIKEKIRAVLKFLIFLEQHVLVQFWSLRDDGEHQLLTTLDQPFGLGVANDELCFYRRNSEQNAFPVDKNHEEQDTSPPARVFRQRLPEWTSDLTNYSPKDFPKKDLAIHCKLHGYLALPVFDSSKLCVGVLELMMSSTHMIYYCVKQVHDALKKQNLTCPQVFDGPDSYVPYECDKIFGILKTVCDIHKLPLAQTWAVSPSTYSVAHDQILKNSCSSFDPKCIGKVCMSTASLPRYVSEDFGMWKFMEACGQRHLEQSEGVIGRALSSKGLCFCSDVTKLNEEEYPLVYDARYNKVTGCFAIFLQCAESENDYVLEFFLPMVSKEDRFVQDVVETLKQVTEITSGFVLGDTTSLDLSDFSDAESIVTDVKIIDSASDPDTESSTNVSVKKRRAAATFTDDGETSRLLKQGRKKHKVDSDPDLYSGGNF